MLASMKSAADFSARCAGGTISHLLFATHSHPGIRELTSVDTPYSLIGRGYAESQVWLSRMHLPRRLVNKPAVDAPEPVGWHHAHMVSAR
jgi:hypothetical protein